MRHIKLILQYDGTGYSGWQVQNHKAHGGTKTIQGVVQDTIRRITGSDVKVIAGSRTDAGVHALAQVASFKTDTHLPTETLKRALNANLPPDVRVMDVSEVNGDFHPRYSAKKKVYSYLISSSESHSVFLRRYTWHIRHDLSDKLDMMRESAGCLIGEHDFSSFRGTGCGSKNPVRVIYDINISDCSSFDFLTFKIDVKLFKITISANAFLRHMVRNIVGTLYDIARGRFKASYYMKELLTLRDRRYAGITAPAHGLFLERIIY